MKSKLIVFAFAMLTSALVFCQGKPAYKTFPHVSDSKEYFKLLFGKNGSINLPYQVLKIDIQNHPYFVITSKEGFKNYFKEKYKLSDSAAEVKELLFLQSNNKLTFSDTVFIPKNMQFGRVDIYHDSVLAKYRGLDLIEFLNKYCPLPQFEQNILALAYMYEKRMLYDWNNQRLDFHTQSELGSKYNIQWDDDTKTWKLPPSGASLP
ncbi:MAG: hypothetical protein IT249_19540 [Chitinophagaceae bacterium]|nr:hypothetical protein [Chitinophagaceae bacterium]